MNKMELFKEFVASHPEIKNLVNEKVYSWQELYERYALNGEEDEVFQRQFSREKKSEEKDNTLNNFFDVIRSVDIDKVADGLNSMKKILSVISEVTSLDTPKEKKRGASYTKDDD